MTDSVINASLCASKNPGKRDPDGPAEIISRLEQYKDDNPECIEYWVETDIDASYLLLAMAASLKHLEIDVNNDKDRIKTLRHYAHAYRTAVQKGNAINYLNSLTDEDALSIYGMRIRAKMTKH
jgi:hypothetical protein